MNAVLDPTAPYRDRFAELKSGLAGARLPWIEAMRETAIDHFCDQGFPTPRIEDWKYTNLGRMVRTDFAPAGENADVAKAVIEPYLPSDAAGPCLVFINGRYRADLSRVAALPEGVMVTSLAAALEDAPGEIEGRLGGLAAPDGQGLTALNTAFAGDGAVIVIDRAAVLEEPIHLVYYSNPDTGPMVSHPRTLVMAGPQSQATIVEVYAGAETDTYWTNAVTEVTVGAGAALRHVKFQEEALAAFHIGTAHVRISGGGRYSSFVLSTGAGLARNEIHCAIEGPDAECRLDGVTLVRGRQHADNTTEIDHLESGSASRETYKAVLDDQARSVFKGRIVVRPDAQKIDANQISRNLLLSRRAQADAKPELAIHADDVKCSHGATVGDLDRDQLFYLRARGIDSETARNLLIEAFVAEMIDDVTVPMVHARLRGALSTWLAGGAHNKKEAA